MFLSLTVKSVTNLTKRINDFINTSIFLNVLNFVNFINKGKQMARQFIYHMSGMSKT